MQSSCAVKGRCCLFIGCTGRRRLAAHNERRHPAELAHSCGSMPHWGIDRCATPQRRPLRNQRVRERRGEQCSLLRPSAKPPLCKGRCPAGAEGLERVWVSCIRKATIPQSALRLTAPFTQGSHFLYPHRVVLAPEGSNGEEAKSVKKRAALLHVLAFCFFDHLFGVLRGEQPLSRASRAIGSSGHLFGSFWVSKRNTYRQ